MRIPSRALLLKVSGWLLLFTAAAKLVTLFGTSSLLTQRDPIFSLYNKDLLLVVGALEAAIAYLCLSRRPLLHKSLGLAWLSTCLIAYRVGLAWLDYRKPCNCLGTLTEILHLSDRAADITMISLLAVLFLCGYGVLLSVIIRKDDVAAAN